MTTAIGNIPSVLETTHRRRAVADQMKNHPRYSVGVGESLANAPERFVSRSPASLPDQTCRLSKCLRGCRLLHCGVRFDALGRDIS
jgi:hypothetical protein